MNIAETRILLTGAAGGIGSAVARELGRRGASLMLVDLHQEALDKLVEELARDHIKSIGLSCDITSEQGREQLHALAAEKRCNVLINVAGINPFGLLENQSADQICTAFEVNTIAPVLLCQAILPVLRKNAPSQIVNLGSSFGSIAYPGFAVYSASKFAVRGFSEALRRELADSEVGVHYLAPRATQTRLVTDRIRDMNRELGVGMDTPEVVAEAVAGIIQNEHAEVFVGAPERFFARINALLPRLVDKAIAKQLPIIRRYAEQKKSATAADIPERRLHQHA